MFSQKNIVKLSQGEFVSLNELELVYFKSTLVSQVCIHGDSQFPFLVAVVVPNLTALHEHFDVELSSTDLPNLESYCDRAEVKELILNDFRYLATLNKVMFDIFGPHSPLHSCAALSASST